VKPLDISGRKGIYLKDKINEFATNSKHKNIRDLNTGVTELKET
jgi:hypothetical protein